MNKITENTLIPISLVITILGGVVWLSTLWARTEAHAEKISKLQVQQESMMKQVTDSNIELVKQLARIEAKLEDKN